MCCLPASMEECGVAWRYIPEFCIYSRFQHHLPLSQLRYLCARVDYNILCGLVLTEPTATNPLPVSVRICVLISQMWWVCGYVSPSILKCLYLDHVVCTRLAFSVLWGMVMTCQSQPCQVCLCVDWFWSALLACWAHVSMKTLPPVRS